MPSTIPANSATADHKPNSSKPSSSKVKRRIPRRGRGRDDLSDEEVEREAMTDSDVSSHTMDSDSDSEEEREPEKKVSAPVVTHPTQPLASSSAPLPKSLPNGHKSIIPESKTWSEIMDAEIAEGADSLPVIDFTELGTLATSVATNDAPSRTPATTSNTPDPALTKLEKIRIKRKAKKEQRKAAATAPAQRAVDQPSPPASNSKSSGPRVIQSIPNPPTDAVEATQSNAPDTAEASSFPTERDSGPPPRPNPRQAYLERLNKDPSFVPRVGAFWGHDDRLLDKDLRSLSPWWRGRGRGGGFRGGRGSGYRGRGGPFGNQGFAPREHDETPIPGSGAEDAVSPSASSAPQQVPVPSGPKRVPNHVVDDERDSGSWHSRGARGGARARGAGRGRGRGRGGFQPPPSNLAPSTNPTPASTSVPPTPSEPNAPRSVSGNGKLPPTGPKKNRNMRNKAPKPAFRGNEAEAFIPLEQRPLTPVSNTSSANVRVKLPGASLPTSIQVSTEDLSLAAGSKTAKAKVSGRGPEDRSESGASGSRPTVVRLPSKGGPGPSRSKIRAGRPLAAAASAAAKSSAHIRSPLSVEIPLPSSATPTTDTSRTVDGAGQNTTMGSDSVEKDPFVVHIPPDEKRADIVRQTINGNAQSHQSSPRSTIAQQFSSDISSNPVAAAILNDPHPQHLTPQPPSGFYPYAPYPPPPPFGGLPPGVAVGENGVLFEIASGRPVILTQPQPPYHQHPMYQPLPPRMAFTPQPQPLQSSRVQTPDSAVAPPLPAPANGSRHSVSGSYGYRSASNPNPNANDNVNGEISLSMDVGPGAPPVPIFVPSKSSAGRSRAVEIRAPSVESSSSIGTSNTASGKSAGTMTNGTTVSTSGSTAGSSLPTSPSTVFVPGSRTWSPTATGKNRSATAPSNLRTSIVNGGDADGVSSTKQDPSAASFSATPEAPNPYYQPHGYMAHNGYYNPTPVDYAVYAPVPVGPDGQPQVQYGGYYPDPLQYGPPGGYYGDPYAVPPAPYGTVYYGASNPYAPPGQPGEEAQRAYY